MRSRRTTYLLLFLAFVFILTIIILCLSPGKSEQFNKERIMADPDIGYTNDVTKSTSPYSSSTSTDNDSGWITKSTTRPTTQHKTTLITTKAYSPTTTTKTSSTHAVKVSIETSTSYETTESQTQKYFESTTQSTTTETQKATDDDLTSTKITTPTTSTATETTTSKTSFTKATTTPTESYKTTTETSTTMAKIPTFTSTVQAASTEAPTTDTETSTTTEAPTTAEAPTSTEAPTTTETSTTSTEKSTTITETPKITQETSSTTIVASATTTETPMTTTDVSTNESSPTTTEIPTTITDIPTITTEVPTPTTKPTIKTTETTTKSAFTTFESTFTTSQPLIPTTTKLTHTTRPPKMLEPFIAETGICSTNDCKTIASKMLDSIDHSEHYCEDFYQYSCGGVVDDPFLSPGDPKSVFDDILKDELSKAVKSDVSTFYESCRDSSNSTEMIQEYLLQISKIDYNNSGEVDKPFLSLTSVELLSKFMKQNLPLFFDVSVEPCHNKQFCLRLSLSFSMTTKIEENYCLKMFTSKLKSLRSSEKAIDLNEEYKNYRKCLSKSAVKIRIDNLKKILDKLDVSFLNLTDETAEILDDLDGFLTEYNEMIYKFDPSKVKKEVMDEENFELMTIKNLEKDPKLNEFIKWRTFLENLGLNVNSHQQVRVYHKDKLTMILELLKELETRDVLKDFLLILWIEHLNINLETSKDANTDYCLEQTKKLMPLHIQLLFLQHLNSSALGRIKDQIREIGVAAIEEVKGSVRAPPMEEVTVELENADILYLENQIVNTYNETDLSLYEYHVTNIINLNEKIRKNNYELIMTRNEVEAPDNIFLLKYQGSHYQLMNNVLLIPATSIVDSAFLFDQSVPNYLKLLGVTNVIVNSLLKQFNISDPYVRPVNDSSAVCLKREASGSHRRKNKFGVDTTFRIDDQRIQREFDAITVNWKILRQFGTSGEKNESSLIWFDANPLSPTRSYFIRKTQMECSESSDLHLLQTVGNSRLPSRERVNLLLKYEPFFAQVFNCSQASKMRQQNVSCSLPDESTEFPPLISSTVADYDYLGGFVDGN